MFTYRLQIKLRRDYLPGCQLRHRNLKQNIKRITSQRRIIEVGHREKDSADLARGYEKRQSKNRGTYRPRWRSWVQFRSVPLLFLANTFCKLHLISKWELVNIKEYCHLYEQKDK